MTGINSYSTTASENIQANTGINWDEGMPPGAVNNSARQNMADLRSAFDDLIWFQYGIGSKAVAHAYASATSTTIAGADVTAVYHAGRRVKAVGSSTGTIYGSISSSSFATSTTTVNYTWDSGSLSNEALTVYLSQVPVTGSPVGPNTVLRTAWRSDIQAQAGNFAGTTGTNNYAITLSPAPASYAALVGVPIRVLFNNGQSNNSLSLNVNGLGAKSLVRLGIAGQTSMFFSDIVAGSVHELVYDGTNFQVVSLNAMAILGSGQARTTTVPNNNTATTIFAAVAGTCVIFYDFGGHAFTDIINFYQGTPVGVAAQSSFGSPGTRTYSMSGPYLQMALSGAPGAANISPRNRSILSAVTLNAPMTAQKNHEAN